MIPRGLEGSRALAAEGWASSFLPAPHKKRCESIQWAAVLAPFVPAFAVWKARTSVLEALVLVL